MTAAIAVSACLQSREGGAPGCPATATDGRDGGESRWWRDVGESAIAVGQETRNEREAGGCQGCGRPRAAKHVFRGVRVPRCLCSRAAALTRVCPYVRNAWRCDVSALCPFGSSLFLEYEPVVVQELALEADLVGAHAGGEREPEIRAGQPTREEPKLQ